MNLPSGLIFFLDFKYGTAVGGKIVNDSLAGKTGPNSPVGSSGDYPDGGRLFSGTSQLGAVAKFDTVALHIDVDWAGSIPNTNLVYRPSAGGFCNWTVSDFLATRYFQYRWRSGWRYWPGLVSLGIVVGCG